MSTVAPLSFRLTMEPLPASPPSSAPARAGAMVTFEGLVRDHNQGRPVVGLDYSAYLRLAQSEGERILQEAIARFTLVRADCVHRLGPLVVGDVAVKVWSFAEHRREAFAGCAYIIDQVKARVPIWKRETYLDGEQRWVACHDHEVSGC